MRILNIAAAILVASSSLAFADGHGDDGGKGCKTKQLAGKWATTFSYLKADNSIGDLSCSLVVDGTGAISDATCIATEVDAASFDVTGAFTVDANCHVVGTLSDAAATETLNIFGEVTQTGDVLNGMVYITDGWFKPLTAIRTARAGKRQHVNEDVDLGPGHNHHDHDDGELDNHGGGN
ncbi:hypothetical protein [Oryzibacter oryziterrae]|uniref:hypothetical protein n=1 Tax=Oryzibacter oryziterrae TaxID=2766474 RepID=UPI001F2348AD|nr:hypothetical protein [Oryzibacter oryziterrae]